MVLSKWVLARCNITRVCLKKFTFFFGSKSLSVDNAVLGPIAKSLLFTMIKKADLNCSLDTNPYNFRHYNINVF